MAKRSSNLKEKVHSLCENIYAITNLTEKSTAIYVYCDKTNGTSQCRTRVRYFVTAKSEQLKKFVTFLDTISMTSHEAVWTLF